jgi:hypothetical protein
MNNKNLIDKIVEASNIIHKSSLRGSANYIMTSLEVADIMEAALFRNKRRKKKINKIFNE